MRSAEFDESYRTRRLLNERFIKGFARLGPIEKFLKALSTWCKTAVGVHTKKKVYHDYESEE